MKGKPGNILKPPVSPGQKGPSCCHDQHGYNYNKFKVTFLIENWHFKRKEICLKNVIQSIPHYVMIIDFTEKKCLLILVCTAINYV